MASDKPAAAQTAQTKINILFMDSKGSLPKFDHSVGQQSSERKASANNKK